MDNIAKITGLVQLMHRAVKINNTALHSFTLFEVTSIIFMTNHHNHAPRMSFYSLHLGNIKTRQLDLLKVLTEGGFSVNRTEKFFAGVPVDMALEQTIIANAKSQLKGIMGRCICGCKSMDSDGLKATVCPSLKQLNKKLLFNIKTGTQA